MSIIASVSPGEEVDAPGGLGRLSRAQVGILVLCGLVGLLDGNDTAAMGIGAPSIAAALQLRPGAIGWAISGSFYGAALGALVFGLLGDRIGRKKVLVAAVVVFGAFTLLTPWARTLPELVAIRILAGLGLGGATPCFITLASEYTPARVRGAAVSAVWASFPLGILVGGLLNGALLTRFSWESIYLVGGVAPLLVAAVLAVAIPESLAFLAGRPGEEERIRGIRRRVGLPLNDDAGVSAPSQPGPRGLGLRPLLARDKMRTTLCIWTILFACFGTTATLSWVPTVLHNTGVSLSAAAVASSFLGLGALIGMGVAGQLLDRFGPVRALALPVVCGAGATVALGYGVASPALSAVLVALVGMLVGVGASGGIALVTLVYPPAVRATGAGWAMSLGRMGQVVLPGLFGILLGANWGAPALFALLGVAPLVAAIAIWWMRQQSMSSISTGSSATVP